MGGGEGEELEPPRYFTRGAQPLLNLIAVTILANPKTFDVVKNDNTHT